MDEICRLPEVLRIVGLSRSRIFVNVKCGKFPSPIRLADRAIGWRRTDLQKWIEERPLTQQGRK